MRLGSARVLLNALSPSGARARLMIFAFHRVLESPDPLCGGEPDADQFRDIVQWISSMCRVLPLAEAVESLNAGTLPARAAAITFDDGYRNNLTLAKPILRDAGLPATVFIAVDAIRTGIMWNDLIIEAVRSVRHETELQDLGLPPIDPASDRVHTAQGLINAVKYLPQQDRAAVSAEIFRRSAGAEQPRLMLRECDIPRLAGDGIDIGAHTMSHPILARIPDDIAAQEIQSSRSWLRDCTGSLPRLFAYPNGRPGIDYDARHVAMVRKAGFSAAVSTTWGAATTRSSLFELPRFTPWERDSSGFASRMIKACAKSYV